MIEFYSKDGYLWVRGDFTVPSEDINPEEIIGIAEGDIKKGDIVSFEL